MVCEIYLHRASLEYLIGVEIPNNSNTKELSFYQKLQYILVFVNKMFCNSPVYISSYSSS